MQFADLRLSEPFLRALRAAGYRTPTPIQSDVIPIVLKLTRLLIKAGAPAAALHGNKSQGARTRAPSEFRSAQTPVLVATDLAARGLDVEDIAQVINYDLTPAPETYVHRIGRTGRAGASGTAVSFCTAQERGDLRAIERLLRAPLQHAVVPRLSGEPMRQEPRPTPEVQGVSGTPDKPRRTCTKPRHVVRGGSRRRGRWSAGSSPRSTVSAKSCLRGRACQRLNRGTFHGQISGRALTVAG